MTITIGSDSFEAYGTTAGLASYANGSLAQYATWSAATADNRARALVEAGRVLETLSWAGEKVSAGQALAWPRTGVVLADGTEVSSGSVPTAITNAAYELALAGLADSAVFTTTTTEDQIKRVNAKGAEVEWFGPRTGGRLPGRVAELVAPYLAGASTTSGVAAGSYASNIDGESQFDACDEYSLSRPG